MADDLHLNPLHARLVELETAFGFQQKLVDDLNSAVLEQARSLQQLEKQVRSLQEQLAARHSAAEYKAQKSGTTPDDSEEDMSE